MHAHHWRIDPLGYGTCRTCGEERQFPQAVSPFIPEPIERLNYRPGWLSEHTTGIRHTIHAWED